VVINLVDYFQVLEDFSKTWIDTPETMQLSSGGGAENPNRTIVSGNIVSESVLFFVKFDETNISPNLGRNYFGPNPVFRHQRG
jgi:hypothetical protein